MFVPSRNRDEDFMEMILKREFEDMILNEVKEGKGASSSSSSKVSFASFLEKLIQLTEGKHVDKLLCKNSAKSADTRRAGNKFYSKKNHNEEIHAKILSLYNKCIALAQNDSEELALGYSNRSALLLHLHKYKECLVDIERACRITKSEDLKKKLEARKNDCLAKLDEVHDDEEEIPPFEFQPSKHIPSASKLVRVKYNKHFGRHVVATDDISPGTVVAVEKGFVLFPNMKKLHLHCSHCLAIAWNGIPCQSCAVAVYCSEKCKEEAWQQYHDIECPVLPYFEYLETYSGCMIVTSLTIRLLIKFIKLEGLENIIKESFTVDLVRATPLNKYYDYKSVQYNKFQSIYNLSDSCSPTLETEVLFTMFIELLRKQSNVFCETANNANFRTTKDGDIFSMVKILQQLKSVIDNNIYKFESYEEKMEDLEKNNFGAIIGLFSSLFNHNCNNNVQRLFTKNQEILLYTTKYVPKGEQLFINYGITDSMSKVERQLFLKNYNFICDCPACSQNWPPLNLVVQNLRRSNFNFFWPFFKRVDAVESYKLIHGDSSKWIFTQKTLKDTQMMITGLQAYYSDQKSYKLTHVLVKYLNTYFKNHYSISYDISANC